MKLDVLYSSADPVELQPLFDDFVVILLSVILIIKGTRTLKKNTPPPAPPLKGRGERGKRGF